MEQSPQKKEHLSQPLNVVVTKTTKHRIDALALHRSVPGKIVCHSEIVREALELGLAELESQES